MSTTMGEGRVREGGSRGEQRSPRAEPAGKALRKAMHDEEARASRREALGAGRFGEAERHEEGCVWPGTEEASRRIGAVA